MNNDVIFIIGLEDIYLFIEYVIEVIMMFVGNIIMVDSI